jgi:hypothetical protein
MPWSHRRGPGEFHHPPRHPQMTERSQFSDLASSMTSVRQIEANRRNALGSTGPKTDTRKQHASQNAVRHGLTAETVIVPLEDAEDYQAFEQKPHWAPTSINRSPGRSILSSKFRVGGS